MTTATESNFLSHLRRALDGDAKRGERAALRRYWSPATRSQAYPVLGQLGALEDSRKAILAALYAQHPNHQSGLTVGKAAAKLGERDLKSGEHPFDRHFRRLLACQDLGTIDDPGDLATQLHRFVKRLRVNPTRIALDYDSLLINLRSWAKASDSSAKDKVLLRWASDFWRAPVPTTQSTPEP